MPKLKPIPLLNFLSKWRLPLCTQMPKLGFWASTFTPSSQTLPRPVDLIPDLSPPSALTRSTVTAPVPSPPLDVLNPLHSQPQWCFFNSIFLFPITVRMKSKALSLLWSGSLFPTIHYTASIWSACRFFNVHSCSLLPLSLCPLPEIPSIPVSSASTFYTGFIEGATPAREPSLTLHAIIQV